jgi:hypothetical protein
MQLTRKSQPPTIGQAAYRYLDIIRLSKGDPSRHDRPDDAHVSVRQYVWWWDSPRGDQPMLAQAVLGAGLENVLAASAAVWSSGAIAVAFLLN